MDRTRLLIAGAVAALVLAGCSGEPTPKINPSDSSSAAAPTSPSPTAPEEPTLPPEAKEPTKAGAEAFVRHYWAMVNYAQATGDTDELMKLSSDSCAGCRGGVQSITSTYESGARIVGGMVTIQETRATRLQVSNGLAYAVVASSDISPQTIRKRGEDKERFAGGRVDLRAIAEFTSGRWMLVRLESIK